MDGNAEAKGNESGKKCVVEDPMEAMKERTGQVYSVLNL
jgi:hypothetical protein